MFVEIIPAEGISKSRPLRLAINQIVVYQNNGTPVMVAGEYGQDRTQIMARVGDDDFNRVLRSLGIDMTVMCADVELPQLPAGARLIARPQPGV